MRTFIEIKEISFEKEIIETKDFPESGFYKLHRKGKVESNDFVYVDKNFPHVILICPIDVLDKLNLKIPEEEIYTEYYKYLVKTPEEKKHPALPNYAKAEESLNALKEKLGQTFAMPEAELISNGIVSADFVLEFTKALLGKK